MEKKSEEVYQTVPLLIEDKNSDFPCVSSKIAIQYNEELGRHSVAASDIDVGDVVCAEDAYSAVLNFAFTETHCQKCFMR